MNGKTSPSAGVLKKLHGVLFQRLKEEERVMPAEVKVLGWRKGERHGMVVRGAGSDRRDGGHGARTPASSIHRSSLQGQCQDFLHVGISH